MAVTIPESGTRELVAQLRAVLERGDSGALSAWDATMWRTELEIARAHGLQGLLAACLRIVPHAQIPPDAQSRLDDEMRRGVLAQGLAYRELDALSDFCAQRQIPFVVLKGAALAKTLYPRMDLRPFGDLDVLIHQSDAEVIRAFLLTRGMREDAEFVPGFRRAFLSEMSFASPRAVAVDLHWQLVLPVYYQRHCDMEWFWQNTEPVTFSGRPMHILNPTAQLVHLCAHVGLHHRDRLRLIWLYDIALLLQTRAGDIRWQDAASFAQTAHLARPVRYVLDQTHAWWGTVLPPETDKRFRANPFDANERIMYALTTADITHARVAGDMLNTSGARQKFNFTRHYMFPDRLYMRTRYGIRRDTLLPLYYAWRLVEGTFRFARSVWDAAVPKKNRPVP